MLWNPGIQVISRHTIIIILYLLLRARHHRRAQFLISRLPYMPRLAYDDQSPTWSLQPYCPPRISIASSMIQAPWHLNFLPLWTVKILKTKSFSDIQLFSRLDRVINLRSLCSKRKSE